MAKQSNQKSNGVSPVVLLLLLPLAVCSVWAFVNEVTGSKTSTTNNPTSTNHPLNVHSPTPPK